MNSTKLQIIGLTKSYKNKPVLKNIHFELKDGDFVGYLGPNGAGKTTTINSILGFEDIDSGEIICNGTNLQKKYSDLNIRVAAILDKVCLYEDMTLYENLMFFGRIMNITKVNMLSRIRDLCSEFHFEDMLQRKILTYSKGMKRKADIIRALLIEPQLLIMDEPFDGIDIENRDEIIKILKHYMKTHQPVVILTSHVMADIENIANKILVIKDGSIIVDESIRKFKMRDRNQDLTQIYLSLVKGKEI